MGINELPTLYAFSGHANVSGSSWHLSIVMWKSLR